MLGSNPGLSGSIDYTAKVPSSKLKGKDHIPTAITKTGNYL